MHELLAWSGRIYPAATLALLGAGLVVLGLRSLRRARRQPHSWPEWALTYLYVFRASAVGLCLVGAGLAWLAQAPWLLAAAVCIALGEFLESSYYIVVLEWGDRLSRRRGPSEARAGSGTRSTPRPAHTAAGLPAG